MFRYIASLPKSTTNWTAPPHPPTVTTRAGLAIGRTGQCPSGRCTFLGRSPAVGRRQGRAGHWEVRYFSRTSRRNSLFTAAPPPPPVNNRDHPPSTTAITPPLGGRSCGCQGRIWFPVQPWSQHSKQSTHT